ncbi:MAG: hypothetical protein IT423_19760 [Pirellulaceae bacterium]|nr:hypothetical protein [Pirellulaceae bacterium]
MFDRFARRMAATNTRGQRSGGVPSTYARWRGIWSVMGLAVLLSGCDSGPQLIPASGVVTLRGQPIADADVVFVPDAGGAPVIGRTDDAGKFKLNTNGEDGAYAGSYKVAVTAVRLKKEVTENQALSMTNEQIAANHVSAVPIKYNNTISSGLTATVSEDPKANNFTLDLK